MYLDKLQESNPSCPRHNKKNYPSFMTNANTNQFDLRNINFQKPNHESTSNYKASTHGKGFKIK